MTMTVGLLQELELELESGIFVAGCSACCGESVFVDEPAETAWVGSVSAVGAGRKRWR